MVPKIQAVRPFLKNGDNEQYQMVRTLLTLNKKEERFHQVLFENIKIENFYTVGQNDWWWDPLIKFCVCKQTQQKF